MSSRKLRLSRNSALSNLNQRKTALEKSRLRVVTELERIDNSLKQIQVEYTKILNDTSPLLNLPTEVTCMIFDLAVASHRKEDHDSKKDPLLPEVVISDVCKRWRDISLNYPRMWTRIFFFANNVKFMRKSLDRFGSYIKRSMSQNLELFIDFREDNVGRQQGRQFQQCELIDMAISVVERWKIVTFISELELHIELHLGTKLLAASAPNLEYFSYSPETRCPHYLAIGIESYPLTPTIFQGGAPKLQHLLLDSSVFKMPPLSNITTLRLEVGNMAGILYPWNTFLEILSIPSLTNLSMIGPIFTLPETNGIPTIPMDNLKHLRYSDNDNMTLLLHFLRAPRLETLLIRNNKEGSEEDFDPNPFGLMEEDYSFPLLHTLTLIDATPSSPDLAWCFMDLTTNITSILIFNDTSGDDFFTAIQEHAPFNDQCWPKLTTITAYINYWDELDVMNDLVRSRPDPKKSFKLRLFRATYLSWKTEFTGQFMRLKGECIVEVLGSEEEAETALMRPMWPLGTDCPDYVFGDDPFKLEKGIDLGDFDI